ncbi:uncharacterized protein LOC125941023 [Dermacentor silvarum]|uniref:uncharacterized protein LOC125941023 n=1 Tax=Dermacentor silvarum TaxID=543639 RepID=UPI00210118B3|nr:uncharacterized protein LOC125941023 [Dermacentor silvarum]
MSTQETGTPSAKRRQSSTTEGHKERPPKRIKEDNEGEGVNRGPAPSRTSKVVRHSTTSHDIVNYFREYSISEHEKKHRQSIFKEIAALIETDLNDIKVAFCGSLVSGLGAKDSDIDMTLLTKADHGDDLGLLNHVAGTLKRSGKQLSYWQ